MTDESTARFASDDVLAISDVLVEAEQQLARYHRLRIQLDADPFVVRFDRDLIRLMRAKRLLSRTLTNRERSQIVEALEYAGVAVALHDGAPLLDARPPANIEFGQTGQRIGAALKVLGADKTPAA